MTIKYGFLGVVALMLLGALPVFADNPVPVCEPDAISSGTGTSTCRWRGHGRLIHIVRPKLPASVAGQPVLFITGGPGAYAAPSRVYAAELADRLNRPVILPDIYGTDLEDDSVRDGLTCRTTDQQTTGPWGIAASAEAATLYTREDQQRSIDACLGQIKLGSDRIAAMSTVTTAKDYRALRNFFGISSWQIVAESYGGRLALTLAEIDADAVDRLVLDSPETPWVASFFMTGQNMSNALKALSDICRDTYRCPGRRMRLEQDLPAKIAAMVPENLEAVAIRSMQTGTVAAYARLTQEQLLIRVYSALRYTLTAETLPYLALAYNDADMQKRFTILLQGLLQANDDLSFTLYHSVRCSEVPLESWYRSLKDEARAKPALRPFLDYVGWRQSYVCKALGITAPDQIVASALPTRPALILSGEFDPVTPPATVAEAFPNLSADQHHFVYRASGHAVARQRNCALNDIAAFLNTPEGSPVPTATTCKKEDLSLRFYSAVQIR